MNTIGWRPDYRGHGINVKFYGGPLADGGTDEQRERAWELARADWWRNAQLIAQEFGYHDVGQDGRSGGWLVPMRDDRNAAETEDAPSENMERFAERISRLLREDAAELFNVHLAEVIEHDAASVARDARAWGERETSTLLAALRYWQFKLTGEAPDDDFDAIACNGGRLEPLDTWEIDALCDRLNGASPTAASVAAEDAPTLAGTLHAFADALQTIEHRPGLNVARQLTREALDSVRLLADDVEQCPEQYPASIPAPSLARDDALVPELVAALRELVAGADNNGGQHRRVHRVDVDKARDVLQRWDDGGPAVNPLLAAVHDLIERADECADLLRGCPDEDDAEDAADGLADACAVVKRFMAGAS